MLAIYLAHTTTTVDHVHDKIDVERLDHDTASGDRDPRRPPTVFGAVVNGDPSLAVRDRK